MQVQAYDCRAEIFRERGHEVLGSVTQGTQMAQPDPFDVDAVHHDARTAFHATLRQVRAGPVSKILLVRGQAGCGKTHLIRALRAQVHAARHGVFAYVHMTSEHGDYRRYLLRQVVRSLSDPYAPEPGRPQQASALDLVSDALVEAGGLDAAAVEALRESDDDAALAELVSDAADRLSEVAAAADPGGAGPGGAGPGGAGSPGRPRFADVGLNTLRVLLYRQSTRKPIQRRVAGFLNGEPLSEIDWRKLAALPRDCDRGPMHLLTQLARVTWAALGAPLVVCVDQIEASDVTGRNHDPFVHAMSAACELIENVPGCMVLLSCLDSAYDAHAPHVIASYRHRIEDDPRPALLTAARTEAEIRQIVSRRLKWLYETEGLEHHPPDAVYPLPEDVPARLQRQDLRTVLQQAHRYWDAFRRAEYGTIPPWPADGDGRVGPTQVEEADVDRLRIAWNEFRTAGGHDVGEDDDVQLELFAWALGAVADELDDGAAVRVERPAAGPAGQPPPAHALAVTVDLPRTPRLARLVGLCDKDARGRGLLRQVEALEAFRAADQTLVVLRSTHFARSGKTFDHVGRVREAGGLLAVVEDPSWQTMQAMRSFLASHAGRYAADVVRAWRRADGPLASLPGISAIVQPPPRPATPAEATRAPVVRDASLTGGTAPSGATSGGTDGGRAGNAEPGNDKPQASDPPAPSPANALATTTPAVGNPPVTTPPAKPGAKAPVLAPRRTATPIPTPRPVPAIGPMVIGRTEAFSPADVAVDPLTLTRHTAIFGANGSGKTVLALTLVERLLERGVGAVLFDRKGDLAAYAADAAWGQDTGAPDEHARRAALRARTDVHLYTPGCPTGRPLVLPLLPAGLDRLGADERQVQARQAAMILCDVCAPSTARADMFAAVLARAVEVLCGRDEPRTLDELQDLLLQAPQDLLALLPAHAPRHCEDVGRRLSERRVAHGRLFSDQGEPLDLRRMLLGAPPGRVRLNVVSTQFLEGDAGLIWIAQFLAAAGRFIQLHPDPTRLQAVLMFDEADQYVPSNRKPATKAGMDNLLRRARSAGVGVILATQNVGDFDYRALDNISTVFAGKLTTDRAAEKLKPRLNDAAARLPKKGKGQFVMAYETDVREIKGHMCLIRPTNLSRDEIERLAAEGRGR